MCVACACVDTWVMSYQSKDVWCVRVLIPELCHTSQRMCGVCVCWYLSYVIPVKGCGVCACVDTWVMSYQSKAVRGVCRPLYYYSVGRPSMIWSVSEGAQHGSATERVEYLAQHKQLHPAWQADKWVHAAHCQGAEQFSASSSWTCFTHGAMILLRGTVLFLLRWTVLSLLRGTVVSLLRGTVVSVLRWTVVSVLRGTVLSVLRGTVVSVLRGTVLSLLRRTTFEDHPKNQAKGILKESWTSVSVCSGTNFKDHPKNQAKGILKGVLPLVSFVHFTWKSEGKVSERNGLKRGVVFHQGSSLSGKQGWKSH